MKKIYLVLLIAVIGILLANPVLRRDITDGVKEGFTGKTEAQRDFANDTKDIY